MTTVAVRELVAFLLRRGDLSRRAGDPAAAAAGVQVHALAARSAEAGYEPEVSLETTIPGDAAVSELRIVGRADGVLTTPEGVTVEEIKSTTAELREIERAREPDPTAFVGVADASAAGDPGGRLLDWAQVLCYAAMLSSARGLDAVAVRLRYVAVPSGETLYLRRSYSARTLGSYLGELARRYAGWIARAEAWVCGREESLLGMAFPFPARRPGQAELEAAVRMAAEQGERLFVQAPTGIGKTLGVLLPALQGMGALSLRRVFYLTPRGTTAEAPLSALELLRSRGARVRSILLCAREKSCLSPGAGCSPAFCRYARGHNDRVLAALESLLGEEAIDPRVTERFAREHRVCPHELALDASEWCDLIIGDYNYVFDPRVYLRRYQDPERSDPSEQLYLVDEAHNLLERAREMYSAELSSEGLARLAEGVETASPELAASARTLAGSLPSVMELCDEVSREAERAVGVSRERPRTLEAPLENYALAAEGLLSDPSWAPADEELLGALFDVLFFRKVLAWFDSRYAAVVEAGVSGLRLRLLCMDPAAKLDERLGFARAAVLFSATLAPLDYYTAVLGGGERAATVSLASPFPRENLCVLVDRSVSTRYRDRPATLSRVAAVVAAVARSRAGSYLAFLPSYEYLRRVRASFQETAPGLALIEQRPGMSDAARREFLERLAAHGRGALSGAGESLVGFAVMGGLFGEAVDLPGEGLIGVIVIGPGLPPPEPERELIRSYYDEQSGQGFAYAYLNPGIGRVLQAAGRVIRSETDRGVAVLVDERFSASPYRELLPAAWEPLPVVRGAREVARALRDFWGGGATRGGA